MHTRPSSSRALRFSELSPERQKLIRLCQSTNFGSIRGLEIRQGQPILDPPPVVLIDLKLDGEDPPRPEINLGNFGLSREVVRLMDRLNELVNTTIDTLEVRAGIPRRVVFRSEIEGSSPTSSSVAGPNVHD